MIGQVRNGLAAVPGTGGVAALRRASASEPLRVAALVALAIALPLIVESPEWRQIFLLTVIYAGLASGLNLLVGYTGLLDLGYVAFFAVGAYVSALVTTRLFIDPMGMDRFADAYWWMPYVDLLPAVLCAGALGAVLGYPTLRARGDYLAIMTLGLGEIVRLVAINWTGLTGGPSGVRSVPPFAVGETQLFTPLSTYYVALTIIGLILLGLWRLRHGHLVRVWQAIREDELSAEAVGVVTRRYKLAAYVVGGMVAGAVGLVFAHTQGFVSPDSFALDLNFIVLAVLIVGGAGTWLGPVVGAALWVCFDQFIGQTTFFQDNPSLRDTILGVLVLVVLFVAPNGLVRLGRGTRGRAAGSELPVPERELDAEVENGHAAGEAIAAAAGAGGAGGVAGAPGADAAAAAAGAAADGARAEAALHGVAATGDRAPSTLTANGLTCRFGGLTAVGDVTLSLTQGEILGLMGPNGAGKTTLLNMLSGVQRPTAGTVEVDGAVLRLRRPSDVAAAHVARTFQVSRIVQDVTVMENVLLGGHRFVRRTPNAMLGIGRTRHGDAERTRAVELLELVGLRPYAGALAGGLDYGNQRRLEIARALMTRPRFLLLDEPAAGMSPREGMALGELLERLRGWGLGLALIEHDVPLLMRVCDRVVALDHGVVVASGPPQEVRRDPTVMRAYLGPMADRFLSQEPA